MDTVLFSDLYPFLSKFWGSIKIYDTDTGSLLFKVPTDGELPTDFDDCEVAECYRGQTDLIIEIVYSFHEIQK